ncbi:MAG: metal ABC transporter permease [Thermodesulfobacteriota bacterium]
MFQFLIDVQQHSFLQYALATGLLASIACGVIGTYVIVRNISYIAGGISHTVLGGIGAALYFKTVHGWNWINPIYGAVLSALIAAMIIGVVSLKAKQRTDTVISALWAVGMAGGILFISQTPGYSSDLMSYLFGNILMVNESDLYLLTVLDCIIVLIGLGCYNQFLAVCFDDEFAKVRGLRVDFYFLLLLGLTALTIVLLVTVVGLVMVIALLTLPIAIAGLFSSTLWRMMLLSALFSALFTTGGLVISYVPDYPPGATTIILAGATYLVMVTGTWLLHRREA